MDESDLDLIFSIIFLVLFCASPFILLCSIFTIVAAIRTSKWSREKAKRTNGVELDVEREALVPNHNSNTSSKTSNDQDGDEDDNDDLVSEADSLDSEAEAALRAEEAEKEADWQLTRRQKFKKEFKLCWKGKSPAVLQKEREREESAKISKAVAKGIERHERRRERRLRKEAERAANGLGAGESSRVGGGDDGLPSYTNAVAATSDSKR